MNTKKKILVFHQALAPYRIDFWNALDARYQLDLRFMYENLLDQKFDQEKLKSRLHFKSSIHSKGFRIGVRKFTWGFLSAIRSAKPDVIFTYEFSQTTVSVFLIKKLFGFKYKILSMCDDSLHIAENCKGVRRMLRNYLVPRLSGLIVVSSEVGDWYNKNFNPKNDCIVFPIISSEKEFRNRLSLSLPKVGGLVHKYNLMGKKCVYFIGRLVTVKGIDRLIRAFAKIAHNEKDSILFIVGSGEEEHNLKLLTAQLKIEDLVLFPGRYEDIDLLAWYNIGELFVLASHYEPFGAVVNEALLAGSTVLCSSNAGSGTLISSGENGEIFDPYDIDGLSGLMQRELKKLSPLTGNIGVKPSKMKISFEAFKQILYNRIDNLN